MYFQDIIKTLNAYWENAGCTIVQPYPLEMGAATLHPMTALRAVDDKPYSIAYVQPSVRPGDGRHGQSANRLHQHHQYQVILKPFPDNLQELYLNSLRELKIDTTKHDVRFIDDNWENPSIGAAGVGWEVWCDGMEVSQFTYMQQIGGIECPLVPGELAYGLERLALIMQGVSTVYELQWSKNMLYGDIFLAEEQQMTDLTLQIMDNSVVRRRFEEDIKSAQQALDKTIPLAAYNMCLRASHHLNILDARNALDTTERASYLLTIRTIVRQCCMQWTGQVGNKDKIKTQEE